MKTNIGKIIQHSGLTADQIIDYSKTHKTYCLQCLCENNCKHQWYIAESALAHCLILTEHKFAGIPCPDCGRFCQQQCHKRSDHES